MISAFGYSMIVVQNMQKSVEFYTKILQKQPEFSSPRWSQFRMNNFLLGIHAADSWSDPNDPLRAFGSGQKGISLGFWVDNIEEYLKYLAKIKIKVVHGPRTTGLGNTIYVIDPNGHYLQICQQVVKKE